MSGLQRSPEGHAADIQQGGNFTGCLLAVLDQLSSMVNLGGRKFVLWAEFHATPPCRLLSGFGAFDNEPALQFSE